VRGLGAADILDLAETGSGPASQALAILARAEPEAAELHRDLQVGARDARLMAVRTATFGPRVELVSVCPHCSTSLQYSVGPAEVGLDVEAASGGIQTRSIDGRLVRFRAVSAGDLVAIERHATAEAARQALLGRCVLAVGEEAGAPPPAELAEPLEAALEALDPQAEVVLDHDCPACGGQWSEAFDAAQVLAADIRFAARRLMSEVASLAATYHWSESDILALPPSRRQFYLEAIG